MIIIVVIIIIIITIIIIIIFLFFFCANSLLNRELAQKKERKIDISFFYHISWGMYCTVKCMGKPSL